MTTTFSPRRRRRYGAIVLTALLAVTLAGCAQAPSTPIAPAYAPGQIDYHGFPYNIKTGS